MADSSEKTPLLGAKMDEDKQHTKKRWQSIRVVYLINFLNGVGFTIVLSTMWQFLERNGGTKSFLGYLVCAFSFGQLIAAPYWGYWASHIKYKYLFHISGVMKIAGNALYIFSDNVSGHRDVYMLESRFLIGLGAANVALCNAYVSGATTVDERTQGMAMLAATNGLGLIVGPLLGVCFGKMKPGFVHDPLVLDYLTMPAVFCIFLETANQLFLFFNFKDYRIDSRKKPVVEPLSISQTGSRSSSVSDLHGDLHSQTPSIQGGPSSTAGSTSSYSSELKHDNWAATVGIIIFFGCMIVISVLETIGTPLTMDEFGWNSQQGDIYNGFLSGGFGLLACVGFILAKPVSKKLGERRTLMLGQVLMVAGLVLMMPFVGKPPKVWTPDDDDDTATREGCNAKWCKDMPAIMIWQYVVCLVLVGIGFPFANVMVFSLFSKILGPKPQGVMMGVLASGGSLARALGPLYFSTLYAEQGPRISFATAAGAVAFMLVVSLLSYNRLVPHPAYREMSQAIHPSDVSSGPRKSTLAAFGSH
eukprot:m.110992 g.110992  ORF g.110992 m.110992 type:complete len:531 (-) comp15936_c0_seq1:329-1921(-)